MAETRLYSQISKYVEQDIGMIYGDTGTGKSIFLLTVIEAALAEGVKVAVCDTEKNYLNRDMDWLQANTAYSYVANFAGVQTWVSGLKDGYKLVIIDSIGAPSYGEFALANMKEKGDKMQLGAAIAYQLKQYCCKNKAMAIMANQPVSTMSVARGGKADDLGPYGGKIGFYVKEVYRFKLASQDGNKTAVSITVHKSRHMRHGHKIATMLISDGDVSVQFHKYQGRKLAVRREEKSGEGRPEPEEQQDDGGPEDSPEDTDGSSGDVDDHADGMMDLVGELAATLEIIKQIIDTHSLGQEQVRKILSEAGLNVSTLNDIKDIDTANAVHEALSAYVRNSDKGTLL